MESTNNFTEVQLWSTVRCEIDDSRMKMETPESLAKLQFHGDRLQRGRYKLDDDKDIVAALCVISNDYALAVQEDIMKTDVMVERILNLVSKQQLATEVAIQYIIEVLFKPMLWIMSFSTACITPLIECAYYSTPQNGVHSSQRFAAILSAAVRNRKYRPSCVGPVSLCLAHEAKGLLPGFSETFSALIGNPVKYKKITAIVSKLLWCDDVLNSRDFNYMKYKKGSLGINYLMVTLTNENRQMKAIRRAWIKFCRETDKLLETPFVEPVPELPIVEPTPKDIDNPRARAWQDLSKNVPILKCPFCDQAKPLPTEFWPKSDDGIQGKFSHLVHCVTYPSGHLLVEELQADPNLVEIKKTRPWKEIRQHAKKCYSKRVLLDDVHQVQCHLDDPMFWEKDLAPLWKGRKSKHPRHLTRKPDGSFNHAFYNKKRKDVIIKKFLEENNIALNP